MTNNLQAHAAIYFDDPDGNSIVLITPIQLDTEEDFEIMTFEECLKRK